MGPGVSGLVSLFDAGVLSGLRLAKPVVPGYIKMVGDHFDRSFC